MSLMLALHGSLPRHPPRPGVGSNSACNRPDWKTVWRIQPAAIWVSRFLSELSLQRQGYPWNLSEVSPQWEAYPRNLSEVGLQWEAYSSNLSRLSPQCRATSEICPSPARRCTADPWNLSENLCFLSFRQKFYNLEVQTPGIYPN